MRLDIVTTDLGARILDGAELTDDGCWRWTRYCEPAGYGRIKVGGRSGRVVYAHRVSYEAFVGPIDPEREIDHLCRNRWCINPDHLEVVDHRTNMLRSPEPRVLAHHRGECTKGHAMTPENTTPDGRCRACGRERQRDYQRRRRGGEAPVAA